MADPLAAYTYMVRHNPNCPSPYEIRTGGGAFLVDANEPRNLRTYGQTFEEAAARMLHEIEHVERRERCRRNDRKHARLVWC